MGTRINSIVALYPGRHFAGFHIAEPGMPRTLMLCPSVGNGARG